MARTALSEVNTTNITDKRYLSFIAPTVPADIQFLAHTLRQADIDECAAGGFTPLDALQRSVDGSFLNYTLKGPTGIPAAIVGVGHSQLGPEWGCAWLLGSEDIVEHKYLFLACSRPFLEHLFIESNKDVFYNSSFYANTVHHEWLRWLGFKFLREIKLPPHDLPFYEFVKLRTY